MRCFRLSHQNEGLQQQTWLPIMVLICQWLHAMSLDLTEEGRGGKLTCRLQENADNFASMNRVLRKGKKLKRSKNFINHCGDRLINLSAHPEMQWLSRCPKLAGLNMLMWWQQLASPTPTLWQSPWASTTAGRDVGNEEREELIAGPATTLSITVS